MHGAALNDHNTTSGKAGRPNTHLAPRLVSKFPVATAIAGGLGLPLPLPLVSTGYAPSLSPPPPVRGIGAAAAATAADVSGIFDTNDNA